MEKKFMLFHVKKIYHNSNSKQLINLAKGVDLINIYNTYKNK